MTIFRARLLFGYPWMVGLLLLCLFTSMIGCGPVEEPLPESTVHLLAADEALEAGDQQKALVELTAAIESKPDVWSYFRRAKLNLEMGNDSAALADCDKGLALQPEHEQLLWLRDEAKKPRSRRFKGRDSDAPSSK